MSNYSVTNFTFWKIKKILKNEYGLSLFRIFEYKGTRYGQPKKYDLIAEDGTIVASPVTLFALRELLTKEGYTEDYE